MVLFLVKEGTRLVDLRLDDIISTAQEMELDTVDVHFTQHSSNEAVKDFEKVEELPEDMDFTFFSFTYKGYNGSEYPKLTSKPQFFGKILYIKDIHSQKEQHILVKHIPGWRALTSENQDPDLIIHEQIEARVKAFRDAGFNSSAYVKKPKETEQEVIGKDMSLEHDDPKYAPIVFHW